MDEDPLGRLKQRLDTIRRERDQLTSVILEDRSKCSRMEIEYQQLQNEYNIAISKLRGKEDRLERYDGTIVESETALHKLLNNSEKLFSALEQESSSIQQFFNKR